MENGSSLGILQALVLGALQGLAEFLPISSSGHLSLLQYFLGLEDMPRFFDVMLHVGTLAAVIAYYRRKLWPIPLTGSSGPWRSHARMAWIVILATLPAVAAATVFRPTKLEAGQRLDQVERTWRNRIGDIREYSHRMPGVVLSCLTFTGFVLIAGSRAMGGKIDAASMTLRDAVWIGLAQAASVIFPGLSRSGMTVSMALFRGLRPEWAVQFSLLMSVPAIAGALVLKSRDLDPAWLTQENVLATLAGALVSLFVGYFSIGLLVGSVRRGRWWWFSLYLWFLAGSLSLFFAWSQ